MRLLPPSDDRTVRIGPIVFPTVAVLLLLLWIYFWHVFRSPAERPWPPVEPGAVVFLGSSTIANFPLAERFPTARTVNLGSPGTNTSELRERLAVELPADAKPTAFVLNAGSYDLRAGRPGGEEPPPPGEIRDRVAGLVQDLQARFPGVPIALIEVLPARDQTDAMRKVLAELNADLAALARDRGLVFVRTNRPPLAAGNGDLPESMSVDAFHLNDAGYRVLAQWIQEEGGPVGALLR
jgi:lysophospholipase L1-like esterase